MGKNTTLYTQLKQCKTIKELYQVWGKERLEKGAYWVLCAWVLLPILSACSHFFWAYKMKTDRFRLIFLWTDYWAFVKYMGIFSCIYVLFYAIGKYCITSVSVSKNLEIQDNMAPKTYKEKGHAFLQKTKDQFKAWLKKSPWNIALCCMLLWACVCTCFSADLHTSLWGNDYHYEGIFTYFYYAAVFILAQSIPKKEYRISLMRLFSIVATIVSIFVVLQDYDMFHLKKVFVVEWSSVFFNGNHLGYYLSISVLCIIALLTLEDSPWWRVFYVIATYIQLWGILVNSTFGGFLGIIFGFLGFTILVLIWGKNKTEKKTIFTHLSIAWGLFFLTLFMSYQGWIPSSTGESVKTNLQLLYKDIMHILFNKDIAISAGTDGVGHGRLQFWITGIKMILASPIVGYGPEMYHEELIQRIPIHRVDMEILQYGVFFGVPGMGLYLYSLFSLFFARIKNLKNLRADILIAAACMISYMGSSCFGNTMFYTAPYFWMIFGLVASESV